MAKKVSFDSEEAAMNFIDQFAFRGQTSRQCERKRRIRALIRNAMPQLKRVATEVCADKSTTKRACVEENLKDRSTAEESKGDVEEK